jgi:uncharacterized protein (DUF302 family)
MRIWPIACQPHRATPPGRSGDNDGMSDDYGVSAKVDRDFEVTIADVKAALGDQGFGVITEIDMQATLRSKIGVEIEPQVILGACNPGFANRALQAEPSIGLLLPCNVVVRRDGDMTVIEMINPSMMTTLTANPEVAQVASEVSDRLDAAMAAIVG